MKEWEQCNPARQRGALGDPECDREDGVWIPPPGAELWGGELGVSRGAF